MPPTPPEPDLQVAARLLAEGRPADAAERLSALVAETPVYAAAHVLHATALEAAGRPDDALGAWGRAAVLVPSSPLVHRERRRLLEAARALAPPSDRATDAAPPPEDRPGEALEGEGAPPDVLEPPAPDAPAPPPEPYDLRAVDERFLRDDDDDAADEPGEPPAAAPPDPADLFFGAPPAPGDAAPGGPPDTEILPPETPPDLDLPDVTPETPGGAGWAVLGEEEVPADHDAAEADVVAPEGHPVADELDALILKLQDAPRIRPDPAFSGPAVVFDDAGADEVASETLAKIYAAQGQHAQAAAVYETLAARDPSRADELLARADEARRR